jgi:trehalose 6-phosphate phosphatase
MRGSITHLFTALGESMLAATLRRRPLLAFDFDGTLAPIVARPDDARISAVVAERLAKLARLRPVAIVTGRAVADVRPRLGFEPHFVVGNHGAEDGLDVAAAMHQIHELDGVRKMLIACRDVLESAGVQFEDKGLSLALHYRLAPDRELARELITRLLSGLDPSLRVFPGKLVENVSPADAPDKADAVRSLVARGGCDCAVFAGDDINDEPVFARAPEDWLTVRIGLDDRRSNARFFLESPAEVAVLLERMLERLEDAGPA